MALLSNSSNINISTFFLGDDTGLYLYPDKPRDYKPTRIIIDGKVTICFFEDGEKIVVRCGKDEPFIEEVGVAEAIVRKLYGTRNKFKKAVANAEHPAHREKKKKNK